eukprot:scaffold120963_cov19-Tisochrysis_lutea.AAC.2
MGMTDSTLTAFVSGSLVLAISSTWAMVICPIVSDLGVPEPFSIPAHYNHGNKLFAHAAAQSSLMRPLTQQDRLPVDGFTKMYGYLESRQRLLAQ